MSTMSEKEDNPIFDKLELLFNLMILNVLWIICSIPVVTIGASSSALNYTCIKLRRNEGDSIVRMFFHSFVTNLKQGMLIGTGMVAILIILCSGLIQALGSINSGHSVSTVFAVVLVGMLFVWIMAYTYIFMVLARFENTILRTITNSFYFMAKDIFQTLKVLGIECFGIIILPLFLWRYVPVLFPVLLFVGVPALAYISAKIFNDQIFAEYVK